MTATDPQPRNSWHPRCVARRLLRPVTETIGPSNTSPGCDKLVTAGASGPRQCMKQRGGRAVTGGQTGRRIVRRRSGMAWR